MHTYKFDKNKIQKILKSKNIKSQTELAKLLGITKNQLSTMLSSKFNPIKSNAIKLCNILDVDIFEILSTIEHTTTNTTSLNTINHNQLSIFELGSKSEIVEDIFNFKSANKFTVVELFAGGGGLALGLEKAGFDSLASVDLDKWACATLRKNRPDWNVIEGDIVKIAEDGIKKYLKKDTDVDLLSGGYPCQAFSYAGHKMGLNDVRGTMFYYYAKILKDLMPKMFLAENVKGLVSHDEGKTLKTMLEVFSEIGYKVQYKVLNAWDYNVAQKRERIVIVGVRNDLDIEYKFPKPFNYKPVLKDILKDVPPSEGAKYPEAKKKILDLVPPGGCWINLPEDIAKEYMGKSYFSGGGKRGMARRLSWDEPSLTLTCSPAQKQTERCHPDETRPFTTREYARIQSFPDDWEFAGSSSQIYKQIGNAVPVNLGKAVGLSIAKCLNNIILNEKNDIAKEIAIDKI